LPLFDAVSALVENDMLHRTISLYGAMHQSQASFGITS